MNPKILYLTEFNLKQLEFADYVLVETFDDLLIERIAEVKPGAYRMRRPGGLSSGFNYLLDTLFNNHSDTDSDMDSVTLCLDTDDDDNDLKLFNDSFKHLRIDRETFNKVGFLDGALNQDFFAQDYYLRARGLGTYLDLSNNKDETLKTMLNGIDLLKFMKKWGITEDVQADRFVETVLERLETYPQELFKIDSLPQSDWRSF